MTATGADLAAAFTRVFGEAPVSLPGYDPSLDVEADDPHGLYMYPCETPRTGDVTAVDPWGLAGAA